MPTPATFRYLRVVVKEMETLGTDLWNPEMARMLKKTLQGSVAGEIGRILNVMREEEDDAVAKSRITINVSSNHNDQTSEDSHSDATAHNAEEIDGTAQPAEESKDTDVALIEANEEKEDNYVRDTILAAPNSLATTTQPSSPSVIGTNQAPSTLDMAATEDEAAVQSPFPAPQAEAAAEKATSTAILTTLPTENPNDTHLRAQTRALTHDKLTQLLFDVAYLQLALHYAFPSSSPPSSSPLSAPLYTAASETETESLAHAAGEIVILRRSFQPGSENGANNNNRDDNGEEDDDDGRAQREDEKHSNDNNDGKERQRIEKAAAEYWRRTYALFGLLGVS